MEKPAPMRKNRVRSQAGNRRTRSPVPEPGGHCHERGHQGQPAEPGRRSVVNTGDVREQPHSHHERQRGQGEPGREPLERDPIRPSQRPQPRSARSPARAGAGSARATTLTSIGSAITDQNPSRTYARIDFQTTTRSRPGSRVRPQSPAG